MPLYLSCGTNNKHSFRDKVLSSLRYFTHRKKIVSLMHHFRFIFGMIRGRFIWNLLGDVWCAMTWQVECTDICVTNKNDLRSLKKLNAWKKSIFQYQCGGGVIFICNTKIRTNHLVNSHIKSNMVLKLYESKRVKDIFFCVYVPLSMLALFTLIAMNRLRIAAIYRCTRWRSRIMDGHWTETKRKLFKK